MNIILALVLIWISFSLGILFGGGLANMRRKAKYSGVINIVVTEDKAIYRLELDHPAEELDDRDEVWFKVKSPQGGAQSQGNHPL